MSDNDEILETEILAMKMFPELRLQIETFTMQKKRIEELEQQIEVMGIEQEQILVANERADLLCAFKNAFSEYWDARLFVASEGPYGKHQIKAITLLCEKGRELEIKLVALFGKEKAKRIAFELNMRHLTDNEIEMISNWGI